MKTFFSIIVLLIIQIASYHIWAAPEKKSDQLKAAYDTLPTIKLPYGNDSDFYENEEQIDLIPLPSEFYDIFSLQQSESLRDAEWGILPNAEYMIFLIRGHEEWGDEQISLFVVSKEGEIIDNITLSTARDEVINSTEQLTSSDQEEEVAEEIGCRSTTFYIDIKYAITITERVSAVGYSEVVSVNNYKISKEGEIEAVSL